MRIRTRRGHAGYLGYCANVHPGETFSHVLRAVQHFGAGVRRELAASELCLGLWLSQRSLAELQHAPARLTELQQVLASAGVFVVTLNGFPYGNFHAEVVKRQVYHPDLSSPERRSYLSGLATVLAQLLPADAEEGTISTLPLGHRAELADANVDGDLQLAAALQLCGLCEELARLHDRSGKSVRICLEPEPGCWLETTDDALRFFTDILPRAAQQCGVSRALFERHLGLCYDTCHQAICFEDVETSLLRLQQAGIRIGKVQLSSAIEIAHPGDESERAELLRFAEPRFLHQVRTRDAAGRVLAVDDLDQIDALPTDQPWRVHFHVPVHRAQFGSIGTTRPFLEATLQALGNGSTTSALPHMEIETYTWSVLPPEERPANDAGLMRGIANEIAFAREALS
ncbi:MAG: hypothetical protein RL701_387 [Pseudomonadota bacterium]